jgi:hypothetical protein
MTTSAATDGDTAAEPHATVGDPAQQSPAPRQHVQLPWETVGLDEETDTRSAAAPAAAPPEFYVDDDRDEDASVAIEIDLTAAPSRFEAADWDWVAYEQPVPAEPLAEELGPPPRGGGWTVAVLCAGIGLLACCVLIPQSDANRRLVHEREKLKVDLESVRKQVATNDEFLRRVADDPNLAERLAQRQMKIIREGTRVLELKGSRAEAGVAGATTAGQRIVSASPAPTPDEMSPFQLVHVAPPPAMPPYEPVGGRLAELCYQPQSRLYLTGFGLLLMAAGLVLGFGTRE